ncbi:MAG TPA: sugar ABC transporter permease [Candidatus Limiplasma sp.]|nr:sugar ABC transporter permease [Candidatus Limiplasma sp.]HRX08218.1 sugar ABC transporter permease [Candidatus Limiplasma sp.]
MNTSAMLKKPVKKRFILTNNWIGYLFVAPLILGLLVFHLYPVIRSFMMSLENTNGVTGTFIGFDNYRWILRDSMFWSSIYNTVYMAVLSLIFNVALSFLLAAMINSIAKARGVFKSIFFIPNVVSVIATSILFTFLFYPTKAGVVNSILTMLGIQPVEWFSGISTSRLTVCIMGAWRMIGYYIIIFMAGLQSVSKEMYEAADVDGVNEYQRLMHITIPSIRPIFAFVIIMDTIASMRRFSDVYMVGGTSGSPGGTLVTTVMYIYRNAFTGTQMGVASAAAFVLFLIILLLSYLNITFVNRPNDR